MVHMYLEPNTKDVEEHISLLHHVKVDITKSGQVEFVVIPIGNQLSRATGQFSSPACKKMI